MATSMTIPKRKSDSVLAHVQQGLYRRLIVMWKSADCGLAFNVWLGQRIEVDICMSYDALEAVGVNAKPKRPSRPEPPIFTGKKSGDELTPWRHSAYLRDRPSRSGRCERRAAGAP
jgi:hypothetical protein